MVILKAPCIRLRENERQTQIQFHAMIKSKYKKQVTFYIIAILLFGLNSCSQRALKNKVQETLKSKIESLHEDSLLLERDHFYNPEILPLLYRKDGEPITVKWDSKVNVEQFVNFIRTINQDGLNPEDYHLTQIEKLYNKMVSTRNTEAEDVVQLELLLTDAFLLLSSHLARGKTDAETIDPQWRAARRDLQIEWDQFLDSTLSQKNVTKNLRKLSPNHHEYDNLRKALAIYQQLAEKGGWERIETNLQKMEFGMTHPDVAVLRRRLSVLQGEIQPDSADANYFDRTLELHVKTFQTRNGLTSDGVVGRQTIEFLNIPIEDRIATIEINLERWRWLSENLGQRYIIVNIANFELQAFENDTLVLVSDAIVGRPYRKTPVFSSLMTYLVLNPDWTVPPTILRNDVIPEIVKNQNYLTEKRMRVLTSTGKEVDPSTVDWNKAKKSGLPYMIRQDPGADNTLGRVKFMFPNPHNVYIHDTPTRNLFSRTDRTFSSGCIRINKPIELTQWLLSSDPAWTAENIKRVLDQGRQRTVHLNKPVHVHIIYLTAMATEDGTAYFRRDVYDRDNQLLTALRQKHYSGETTK